MIQKRNIFLIGPMGSGKSTIGKKLSDKIHMKFFDSDIELEKQTGASIDWIFDIEGEAGFRKREKKIINELTQKKGIILATGGGTIKSKHSRNYLSSRGIVIYLKISIKQQLTRIQSNKNRPILSKSSLKKKVLQELAKERNFLYKKISDVTLNTERNNISSLIKNIIHFLEKKQFFI